MSIIKSFVSITAVVASLSSAAFADGKITGTVTAKPSKFLDDTIVFVKSVPSSKPAPKTIQIDQKGMAFSPHIVLGAVGDTVKFQNHDKVEHNVISADGGYDLGVFGTGLEKEQTFKKEGVFAQVCKLHPEMLAYVFIGQNRFASVVDANGGFAIDGLPAGTYELDIWNPKLKAGSQKVTVSATGATAVKFALTR